MFQNDGVLEQNLSYKDEFDLHENEPVDTTHFHVKGFERRLVKTQRQKSSRKWSNWHSSITPFTRYCTTSDSVDAILSLVNYDSPVGETG